MLRRHIGEIIKPGQTSQADGVKALDIRVGNIKFNKALPKEKLMLSLLPSNDKKLATKGQISCQVSKYQRNKRFVSAEIQWGTSLKQRPTIHLITTQTIGHSTQ